jgi:hypothetical protein
VASSKVGWLTQANSSISPQLDGRLPRRFHVVAYHHPSSALSLARPSHDRQLMGVDTSHWRGPVHGRKVASSISSGSSRRQSPTQACSKPYSHPSSRDRSTSFPSPALSNASSTQSHSRTRSVSPRCSLPPLSALTSDQKAAILPSHPLSRLPRCIALGTCSQSTHQTTSNLHSAPLLFLSYLLSHTPASLVIPSRQNLMKISVC